MIRSFFVRALDVWQDAFRLFWLAPIIPLIAIVPEFIQHVVEVQIGMFESRDAAIALANDPTRWAFGYAKLAGYLIAILLTIRFFAARRAGQKWWSASGLAWRVLAIAFAANVAISAALAGVEFLLEGAPDITKQIITLAVTIATMPFLVWLVAGLVGDKAASIVQLYRTGWLAALRIVVFSAMVLLPLMWLHGANHDWAFGAASPIAWSLMVFDSLLVGLLAAAWGAAIHHGYIKLTESTDRVTAE